MLFVTIWGLGSNKTDDFLKGLRQLMISFIEESDLECGEVQVIFPKEECPNFGTRNLQVSVVYYHDEGVSIGPSDTLVTEVISRAIRRGADLPKSTRIWLSFRLTPDVSFVP